MRFITDCPDCGSVVLRSEEFALVGSPEASEGSEAVYECPICMRVHTMAVTPGVFAVLLACGVQVLSDDPRDHEAPLTLLHLAKFQSLLSDDDAWRQVLDEA